MKTSFRSLRWLGLILLSVNSASAQSPTPPERRVFVGSSAFSLLNAFPDPADFYQLDVGYRLTSRDVLIVEALTWKYHAPLGIPWGSSFGADSESYPGYVRSFGIGLHYQRYLYQGLFVTAQAGNMLQQYHDHSAQRRSSGYQLFLQGRLGYHFSIVADRVYIEPSVAFNYWPIETNRPAAFQEKERHWPNYFLFEPGLNFGVYL